MLRVMEAVEGKAYQLQNPGSKKRRSSSSSSSERKVSGARGWRNNTNGTNGTAPIDFPGGASEAYLQYEAFEPYLKVLSTAVLEDGELPRGTPSYAAGAPTCRPTTFKVGGVAASAGSSSSRVEPDDFGPTHGGGSL